MQITPMDNDLKKMPPVNITMSDLKSSNWIDLKTRAVFFVSHALALYFGAHLMHRNSFLLVEKGFLAEMVG